MKLTQLKELVRTVVKEEEEYKDLFKKMLDMTGKNIDSMSDTEKKAFFNAVDKAYVAKNEGRLSEGFDSQEKSGKEIADKMRKFSVNGVYILKPWADKVEKMETVTAKALDNLLPDYIQGYRIYNMFAEQRIPLKEGTDVPIEKIKVGQYVIYKNDANATPFYVKDIEKSSTDGKQYIILRGSNNKEILKRLVGMPVRLLSK